MIESSLTCIHSTGSAMFNALLSYIGPGSAVSAVGAVLAAVAGIFVALLGFLWYPIRRLLRKKRTSTPPPEDNGDA